MLADANDYESWGNYAFYSSKSLAIDFTQDITITILNNTIKVWIGFEIANIILKEI